MHLGGAAHAHLIGPTCRSSGPRAGHRANVQVIGPTCAFKGPRAGHRAHVQDVRPTCRSSGPRAGHRANVRLQGPACRSSGQRAPSRTRVRMGGPMRGHVDPGALTAMLPDGNCGTVVAGPSNWTRLLAVATHSPRTSTHLAAERRRPRSTRWVNVHMTMPEPPHTRHNAGFTGTRQTQPPKKATVPHQKTEKSPYQQHAVSYNPRRPVSGRRR